LRNNELSLDQAIHIADILKSGALREINLNFNKLGDSGAEVIL